MSVRVVTIALVAFITGCGADEVSSFKDAEMAADTSGHIDAGLNATDMHIGIDAGMISLDLGTDNGVEADVVVPPLDAEPLSDAESTVDAAKDANIVDVAVVDAGCAPRAEQCNGADEDCDGIADEGLDLGSDCIVGEMRCGLPGTRVCAPDGTVTCEADPMAMPISSPEECNGLDDDCDGQTDEDIPEGGQACDSGRLGRCSGGAMVCQGGRLQCQSNHQPRQEQCDGEDDDCDGAIDNIPPVAGCETGRSGVCGSGRLECTDGQLSCIETVQPQQETCDALDNDCDGSTDEDPVDIGQNCNTGRRGECRSGRQACVAGMRRCVSIHDAVPELCDELDQDCDGRVDEEAEGTGLVCDPGWGTPNCQRRALMECQVGQLICVRDPQPEDPCDGFDTDCDGRIGEDVLGQECQIGAVGQCDLGGMICEEGAPLCVASFEPSCELMNELDDDCDGQTDEAPERFCAPAETQVTRFCLDDNDRIAGFDMVVDPHGEIWAVRASITSGTVYMSHIGHDGTEQREQVYGRTAIAGNFPMMDAAITLHNDAPAVCFWKATTGTLFASLRDQNAGWSAEEIIDRDASGEDCDIASVNGQLVIAYRDADALWLARRDGGGQWRTERIDNSPGSAGYDLDLLVHEGSLYIAHTDRANGQLRVSHQLNGNWRTVVVAADRSIGYRPSVVIVGQRLYVIHGERPQNPDRGGDSALLFTELRLPNLDQEDTLQIAISGQGGGQALMPYGEGLLAIARARMRDAVFGDQDALVIRHLVSGSTVNYLEVHDVAQRRHTFTRLRLKADPFGLPVVGFVDEGGSVRGDPGFGRVCFYRPNDLDGDHVPDVSEVELGTDPDRPDTDGDGRTDGQEVLHDGTDPIQP